MFWPLSLGHHQVRLYDILLEEINNIHTLQWYYQMGLYLTGLTMSDTFIM
jgi:hypothetical protein